MSKLRSLIQADAWLTLALVTLDDVGLDIAANHASLAQEMLRQKITSCSTQAGARSDTRAT